MRFSVIALLSACSFTPPAGMAGDGSLGLDAPPESATCGPTYTIPYGKSRYHIERQTGEHWRAAERACEATGGHLAVINDPGELAMLLSLEIPNHPWIGAIQTATNLVGTDWIYVDSRVVDAASWQANKPDDFDSRENGQQQGGALASSGLDDEDVKSTRDYVCECDGVAIDPRLYQFIPE